MILIIDQQCFLGIVFLSAGVHRDLLDHVLGKVAELSGHGNIAGLTDTQAAIGALATREHLEVCTLYMTGKGCS